MPATLLTQTYFTQVNRFKFFVSEVDTRTSAIIICMQSINQKNKRIQLGIYSGLVFGLLAVLVMLPLEFSDKAVALTAAFVNRFAIGLLIPTATLKMPYWLQGVVIALLLSFPEALVTGSFAPILGMGVVGGLLIGLVSQKKLGGHNE